MSRTFILDYDLVSAIGVGRDKVLKNINSNFSGAKKLSRFSTENLACDFGAEVTEPLAPLLGSFSESIRGACRYDRKLEMILACYVIMQQRLKSFFSDIDPLRTGLVFGLGIDISPIEELQKAIQANPELKDTYRMYQNLNATGDRVNLIGNPLDIPCTILARELNIAGFQKSALTACSASSQAVAFGAQAIRRNQADLVLVGGTDSLLNLLAMVAFAKLGIISPSDETPDKICKPLDRNRNSVLLGEGAGLMVLASESYVKSRGLRPTLEISGFGNTLDGYKITAPDPEAKGMTRAIQQALQMSEWKPEDVNYINMHGTGTMANDPLELKAIQQVFGHAAKKIAVSSTKDRHGHTIAAAGIIEICLLALAMENAVIPCTRNLQSPIREFEIDMVQSENRKVEIRKAMSNSFAFGGVNTVLAVQRI